MKVKKNSKNEPGSLIGISGPQTRPGIPNFPGEEEEFSLKEEISTNVLKPKISDIFPPNTLHEEILSRFLSPILVEIKKYTPRLDTTNFLEDEYYHHLKKSKNF